MEVAGVVVMVLDAVVVVEGKGRRSNFEVVERNGECGWCDSEGW